MQYDRLTPNFIGKHEKESLDAPRTATTDGVFAISHSTFVSWPRSSLFSRRGQGHKEEDRSNHNRE